MIIPACQNSGNLLPVEELICIYSMRVSEDPRWTARVTVDAHVIYRSFPELEAQ